MCFQGFLYWCIYTLLCCDKCAYKLVYTLFLVTKILAPWEITCKIQFVPFIIPLMLCMYAFGIKLSYFGFFYRDNTIKFTLQSCILMEEFGFSSFEILDWIKDDKGRWLVLNHRSSMLNYNKCVVSHQPLSLHVNFSSKSLN